MTTIDTLRRDLATVDADLTATERQAATAETGELSRLGGLLAGLSAKRRAIEGALSQALGLEAAKARKAQESAAAAERQAFISKLADLEAGWAELLTDFNEAGDIVAGLWVRYRAIMQANANVYSESVRLGVELGAYNVGALSGSLLEAKQGAGVLSWKG